MSISLCLLFVSLLFPAATTADHDVWPKWQLESARRLKCGMTLEEVQGVLGRPLKGGETYECRRGEYWITRRGDDLYLYFPNGTLSAVSFSRLVGLMGVARAPLKDLCTGDISFLITIELPNDLVGATITADGTAVTTAAKLWQCLPIGPGKHEIRVEKPGRPPITKHIELSPNGRGNVRIRL